MIYLIFIPDVMGPNVAHLEKAGIADLARDCAPSFIEGVVEGKPGMIAMWLTGDPMVDPPMSAIPGEFDWTPAPTEDEKPPYYLGIHKDPEKRPGPDDLRRTELYDGLGVTLANGQEWQIPSAQRLPRKFGLNSVGRVEGAVRPEFVEFCTTAAKHAQAFFEREEEIFQKVVHAIGGDEDEIPETYTAIPLEDAWLHSVDALALNYRANAFIVSQLGIIDSEEAIVGVCCAAIDLPAIERIQKKSEWEPTVRIPAGSTF